MASSILNSKLSGEADLKELRSFSFLPPRILVLGSLKDTKHYEVNSSCVAGYNQKIIDERKQKKSMSPVQMTNNILKYFISIQITSFIH